MQPSSADALTLTPLVFMIFALSYVKSRRRMGLDMAVTLQRCHVVTGDVRQAELKRGYARPT